MTTLIMNHSCFHAFSVLTFFHATYLEWVLNEKMWSGVPFRLTWGRNAVGIFKPACILSVWRSLFLRPLFSPPFLFFFFFFIMIALFKEASKHASRKVSELWITLVILFALSLPSPSLSLSLSLSLFLHSPSTFSLFVSQSLSLDPQAALWTAPH